jgi:UDP-N-acetylglucosamine transferase subunit ALG13
MECNDAGHEVTLILRDLLSVNAFANKLPATILQAPVFLPRLRLNRQLVCIADALQLSGYEHGNTLLPLVKAWQALLSMLKADVLVFDNAPTALLAASSLNCRKLIVGNGFGIPVAGHKLADWQPMQSRAELIQEQEQYVLKIVNQVQRKLELPVAETLSGLYSCDRIVIDSFPQFDVYRELRKNADYYATTGTFLPAVFGFREAVKQRIVCLLDPAFKKFTPLVEALRACGCEILCVLPGGDPERLKPYQSASFQTTTLMPNLELIIREADMFIGHGNLGSITLSLRWGKPMLILPMQLEQLHAGVTVQSMGLGKVLADQDNVTGYQKAITGILGNIKMRGAARTFATNNRVYAQSTFGKGVLAAFDDNTLELRQRM